MMVTNAEKKPTHIKPSLYAYFFADLKDIAFKYGYNLVLHGSLNRDLDLIAIAWQEDVLPYEAMISEMCEVLGGEMLTLAVSSDEQRIYYRQIQHGRVQVVINIRRMDDKCFDHQMYLDISIIPPQQKTS